MEIDTKINKVEDSLVSTNIVADRLFIPDWLLSIYTKTENRNVSRIWPVDTLSFFPELSSSEVEAVLYIIEPIQHALLNGRDNVQICLSDLLRSIPYSGKLTQDLVARLAQMLQGLSLIENASSQDGTPIKLHKLIENSHWKRPLYPTGTTEPESLPLPMFIAENFQETQKDLLIGHTTGFRRTLFDVFESLDEPRKLNFWSNAPLSICKHMWADLSQCEKSFLIECEKATQTQSQWLSIDGHFYVSANKTSFPAVAPRTKQTSAPSDPSPLEPFRKAIKKLVDHGYLETEHERPALALSCVKKSDFPVVVLRQCLDRSFLNSSLDYYNLYLRTISRPYFFKQGIRKLEQIYRFQGKGLSDSIVADLNNIKESCRVNLDKIGAVDPVEIFVELKLFFFMAQAELLRIQQKSDLIVWLETLIRSCPISLEGYLNFRENFVAIEADLNQKFGVEFDFLGISMLDLSGSSLKLLRDNYISSVQATTRITSGKDTASPKIDPPESSTITIKPATVAPSYSLRQVASDELDRLRNHVRPQYLKVVDSYITSLSDSRQKVVAELKKTLSQEAFENHIKQGLVRYMIENPNAWGSSGSLTIQTGSGRPSQVNRGFSNPQNDKTRSLF